MQVKHYYATYHIEGKSHPMQGEVLGHGYDQEKGEFYFLIKTPHGSFETVQADSCCETTINPS